VDDGCHSVSLGEQVTTFLGLLDPEDGGTVILGNKKIPPLVMLL